MLKIFNHVFFLLLLCTVVFGQSESFKTFMNPIIPGDHPDCTLTKVGNDFYTTGSSFNPTPVIYHSTDLVHWEAVAQPVSAAWSSYGDAPAGGCWGGQVVYYNNKWWDFFSRSNQMYFVTADSIRGQWTLPTLMNTPSSVPGLGYDNSIFVDDDSTWYLLVKNGQANNWIVQLGSNGQPSGKILNMTWLNPSPSYPYSWAEGPVMWKYNGYYYYSFAKNVAGGQYFMRSKTLTDSSSSWTTPVALFNTSDPQVASALFQNPNHNSAAVMINDSTSWIVHPLWRNGNNNEWYGQGRQGLLNQVNYDANGMPVADYPINLPKTAPNLPSSGIPWMVPHSDFFNSDKLNPEWSFEGYTPASSYSLSKRPGWLLLSDKRKANTIIKNDGEHNYSLITLVDFDPQVPNDQAGLCVFNGLQTIYFKLYSTIDTSTGKKEIIFSSNRYTHSSENTAGNNVWLKLVRVNHMMTGCWSPDGFNWTTVDSIDATELDGLQTNYNSWTGNRQGLFVQNSSAYFNFYIYRDAYTPILAECPANQYGTTRMVLRNGSTVLDNINNNDWALYAGVEFGNSEYLKNCDSLKITASCPAAGGNVEVYIDSINASTKIAVCSIGSTGSLTNFETFTTNLLSSVTGNHDVYLKFTGSGNDKLFQIQSFQFTTNSTPTSVGKQQEGNIPKRFYLDQNYPNPFNPGTIIKYQLSAGSKVQLKVYDLLGREVATLVNGYKPAGNYSVNLSDFSARHSSGVYFYGLKADNFFQLKKMALIK
jgi:Beta-xylosidase